MLRCSALRRRRRIRWPALLPLALLIGLFARGHLLQAIGIALACTHPDTVQLDAETHEASDEGAASHDHCPTDCARCPCGQMPLVIPPEMAVARAGLLCIASYLCPTDPPGRTHVGRLDRPPQPA